MTTLVKSLGDFLNLLVQAFNLSSIFPAFVFVILLQLYVLPVLPEDSPLYLVETMDISAQTGVTVILVVLLAYLLDAANMNIIRLLEGYYFSDQFPFDVFRKHNQDHVEQTVTQIRQLESWIDMLTEQAEREHNLKRRKEQLLLADQLADHHDRLLRQITDKYPEDTEYVLATPFGNVIAAAEQYPRKAFGMDAIVLWPFLRPILTEKNYAQFVVREKAVMDFLVNLTVVLAIFGGLFGLVEWFFTGFSWLLVGKLTLIALACCITFLLSVQGAASWGVTIRTSFVVFRDDLRQALRLRKVRFYKDERELWETASDFFRGESSDEEQIELGQAIFDASSYRD